MSDERILIVDDKPMMVKACSEILTEEGYQVQEACGGREALTRLEEERFDLLVVDLRMPGVDGLTVLRRARELDPDVMAIVMTSYGKIENAIEALRAGARDFLRKPFEPDDLLRAADEALAARRREQERLLLRARLPILEISQALMAEGDIKTLAGRLLEVVARQIGAEQAALLMLDEGTDELYVAAAGQPDEGVVGVRVPAGEGIARQALLGGEALVLETPSPAKQDPLWPAFTAGPGIAAVCVPLHIGEKAIGLLNLSRAEQAAGAPFSPAELNLLSIMGSQIASALENTRLYEALRRELAERARAESQRDAMLEALRKSEATLKSVLRAAPIGIGLVTNRVLQFVNARMCSLVGYSRDELIGHSARFLYPSDAEFNRVGRVKYARIEEQGIGTIETRFKCEDGHVIDVLLSSSAIDPADLSVGVAFTAMDITERVQAEKALWESEARYRDLFDNSPISLWEEDFSKVKECLDDLRSSGVSDLRAHLEAHPDITAHCARMVDILGVNKATIDLFEAESKDEILGNLDKLFIDQSLKVFREEIITLYEGKGPFRGEIIGKSLRGNLIDCIVQVTIAPGCEDSWSRVLVSVANITARKRAEEALRESEEHFRLAFEGTNIGMCLVDLDGRLTRVNNRMGEIFGYSKEELESMTVNDIAHPEDLDISPRFIQRASSGEIEHTRFEKRYLHKRGYTVWGQVSSSLVRDFQGAPLYFISHVQDVTKRKRAEETLRESEERYRTLFERTANPILVIDTEGNYIDCNGAALQFAECTRDELLTKNVGDFVLPDKGRQVLSEHQPLWDSGGTVETEYYIHGKVKILELTVSPAMWQDKRVVFGVGRDITERKQLEEALKDNEQELLLTLAATTDGIWKWDFNTDVLFFSPRYYTMLGYEPDEFPASYESWRDLIHPDDLEAALSVAERYMETKPDVYENEFRLRTKTGDYRWIQARARVVERNEKGVAIRMIGNHEDITERVRSEEGRTQAEEVLRESEAQYRRLVEGSPDVDYRTKDSAGNWRWFRDRSIGRRVEGSETIIEGISTDITARKRAEEALHRSLDETAHNQRLLLALSQAAQAVQRARTPDEVYRTVGDEVVRLGYNASIYTLTADQAHLALAHMTFKPALLRAAEKLAGLSAQEYRFEILPGGIYDRIIFKGLTIFRESAVEATAEALPRRLRPLAGQLVALLGGEQAIHAPLTMGGETVGLLAVSGAGLTEADVPAMTAFANQAGIALENARLLETITMHTGNLQRMSAQIISVQEAERQRISQELHDEMGQALTAMSINLAAIEKELPPELAPVTRERLAETSSLADQTLEQVRELALDLRPAMLDDLGLAPAVRWYVNRFAKRLDLEVELEMIDLDERLAPELETALYRVVQEALTNVARHAQANRVRLRLERKPSTVVAVIEDDGIGFDVAEPAGHVLERGVGLVGAQERIAFLGGSLSIQSRPGQGTRLSVKVPLRWGGGS